AEEASHLLLIFSHACYRHSMASSEEGRIPMSNPHATLAVETVNWQEQLPRADWEVYQPVLQAVLDEKLPFAVGGGFVYSTYANRWRYTKDLDLFILPQHRREITAVLTRLGFTDYY